MYHSVDLFSGAGGITEGFRRQGDFSCLCATDFDPSAGETFSYNHPNVPFLLRDIKDLTAKDMLTLVKGASVDVVTGGPPCQGFSLAGQRLDDDPRNFLFKEYIRIAASLRPKVVLFENVYGLLSMQRGEVLLAILSAFREIGYDCKYRVVNAADYGVPQNRPRFVLVGVKSGLGVNITFPRPSHGAVKQGNLLNPNPLPSYITVGEALSDLPSIDQGEGADIMEHHEEYSNSYQLERRGCRNPGTIYSHKATKHSKAVQSRYAMIPQGETNACLPADIRTKKNNVYRLDMSKPARTITCNFRTDLLHPTLNRGLTVREAARLQSFDDDYRFFGCLTRKAKWLTQDDQVGNAVPPLMASAFAEHLSKVILPQFE